MASSQTTDVVVFLLDDGATAFLPDFDDSGRTYESGDKVDVKWGLHPEAGVVLGSGADEQEARFEAKRYLRRLLKWHGAEHVSEVKLFGQELSQTQHLLGDLEETHQHESEVALDAAEANPGRTNCTGNAPQLESQAQHSAAGAGVRRSNRIRKVSVSE